MTKFTPARPMPCLTPGPTLSRIAALTATLICAPAFAGGLDLLPYALSGGTPNLDARLRYEQVDQDNLDEPAEALTARLRLGYTTAKWNDFDAQGEFEGVYAIGDGHFNDTGNGELGYPVVADPEGEDLNQAWLRWTGLPKTAIKQGRQRIVLDNARFIGNVGWRQQEQTYDATLVTTTLLPKTTLNLGQLSNARSFRYFPIDGRDTQNVDLSAWIANAKIEPLPWLAASLYGYWLDFETDSAARQDTQTLGVRLAVSRPAGKLKLSATLEFAQQQDYADAPDTADAQYTLIEAGVALPRINAKLGYEVLGSNDGLYGFQTPLATLHIFQGWADQFPVTPVTGVEDRYLQVGAALAKFAWIARWHQFSADEGGADYGSELDLQVTRPVIEALTLGLKYAAYDADEFPAVEGVAFDTAKFWAFAEYQF